MFLYSSAIIVKPNMFKANKSGQIRSYFSQCKKKKNGNLMNTLDAGLTELIERK